MASNKWLRHGVWFAGCLAIAFILAVATRVTKTHSVKAAAKQVLHIAPPVIPAELRAKWWRAQAEFLAADRIAQGKKAEVQNTEAEMKRTCGDYPLNGDPSGEPACQEKK